ncbi:unnamed protein product, partial [Didymodactylos carnosus]
MTEESLEERVGSDGIEIKSQNIEFLRSVSQTLRNLDDAIKHSIEQLKIFNNETMTDLTLKFEQMRHNESRVIGLFAHQILQLRKDGQNGEFKSEYPKLDRFLTAIGLSEKSIEYIVRCTIFEDLFDDSSREKLLYDAQTTETERNDFKSALQALKDCIEYFSHEGGKNDDGRFFWHAEKPPSSSASLPQTVRQHRLSDTALPVPPNPDTMRSNSVSSISTELSTNVVNTQLSSPLHVRRRAGSNINTPPPSRSNHLCVKDRSKCEHPSKKSSVDPTAFMSSTRNYDLQLPDGTPSRRSSYGSDTDSRLPS